MLIGCTAVTCLSLAAVRFQSPAPIAFALVLAQGGYTVSPFSRPPLEGELSAATVFQIAKTSATAAGLPMSTPAVVELEETKSFGRRWSVLWPDKVETHINPITGSIELLTNTVREDLLQAGRAQPTSFLIANEQAAKTRALAIFRAAGAPQDIFVAEARLTEEVSPGFACATVEVKRRHLNRRILGAFGLMTLDRADGVLVSLQQSWSYVIETEHPILSVDQARSRARYVYEVHLIPSDPYPPAQTEPELAYVHPGDAFGSSPYPKNETILRMRLAYIVAFGPDKVWIDAVTGGCLGGSKAQRRPQ